MMQLLSASETLFALKKHLSAASSIQIAVAFLSQSGLDQLNPELEQVISLGEASEAIIGLDPVVTDANALGYLVEIAETYPTFRVYCHHSGQGIFHPKFYVLQGSDIFAAIVGSSNLTAGGFVQNVELNVLIEDSIDSEAAVNSLETFVGLKQLPDVSPLTSSILNIFEDYTRAAKKIKSPISDEMKSLSKMLDTEIAEHRQVEGYEPRSCRRARSRRNLSLFSSRCPAGRSSL